MSLTNAQYQEIMRMYEARRLSNYNLSRERRREVYAQIPEMRDLDREMTHNSILLGKQLVTAKDQQPTDLCRQKNQKLADQKRQLLLDRGFSRDYLDPVYTCPDCKDTGYIGTKKCHCFRQAVTRLILARPRLRGRPPSDRGKNAPDGHPRRPWRRPLHFRPGGLSRDGKVTKLRGVNLV